MDTFDLGRLTDFDFEVLCKDVFEKILNVHLEVFSPGVDGGIDLRYAGKPGATDLVIQCKHWIRSSASTLMSHMRSKELPKIEKINPARYILITSISLSRGAKDQLVDMLYPYARPGDIYGLDELLSELRNRPDIVQRHFRLWLSGTGILQGLLKKELLERSAHLVDDARELARTYVPNRSLDEAMQLLESHGICLITGTPGVGKTTLAHMLLALYVDRGWIPYDVTRGPGDIYSAWDDDIEQFFYFDDFLGQTSLSYKFARNEDADLIRLLRLINGSANKRLVLTTREYLLEQARIDYERIARQDFHPWNCVISLDSYSRAARAQILYNHLYFADIAQEDRQKLTNKEVYSRIIDHDNFNPRLVAQSIAFAGKLPKADISATIFSALNNPQDLWEHILEYQLEPGCSDVLVVLLTLRRPVLYTDVEMAFESFLAVVGEKFNRRSFARFLRVMDGSMIKIDSEGHPSMRAVVMWVRRSTTRPLLSEVDDARGVLAVGKGEFGEGRGRDGAVAV